MKKFICLLTALLLLSLSAGASRTYAPVIDNADLLSGETGEIFDLLDRLTEEYGLDAKIVTESEMRYADAAAAAEYCYDRYCTGDGILLYISASPREYYIETRGEGRRVYTGSDLKRMEEKIVPHLREDAYTEACIAFAEEALYLAGTDAPKNVLPTVLCVLLLPLVLAFIMTAAKSAKMKTARAEPYASNYIRDGSFRLDVSRDLYLYSTVTKTPRPKANHTSGGGSRGGRGGKY